MEAMGDTTEFDQNQDTHTTGSSSRKLFCSMGDLHLGLSFALICLHLAG